MHYNTEDYKKNYKIKRKLAVIKKKPFCQLQLNLISWNDEPPVYDFRVWVDDYPHGLRPGKKGIMFSPTEANKICSVLLEDMLRFETRKIPPEENDGSAQSGENKVLTVQTIIAQ